jgi:hypothetical protein
MHVMHPIPVKCYGLNIITKGRPVPTLLFVIKMSYSNIYQVIGWGTFVSLLARLQSSGD